MRYDRSWTRQRALHLPVRWVHNRRGDAPTTQHVLAVLPPGEQQAWKIPVLCGEISAGRQHRTLGRSFGPKTRRPLVTVSPSPVLPVCRTCARRLTDLRTNGVVVVSYVSSAAELSRRPSSDDLRRSEAHYRVEHP